MKFILSLFLLASCSWFRQDEEVDIKNPKPGMEIDIKQETQPKAK